MTFSIHAAVADVNRKLIQKFAGAKTSPKLPVRNPLTGLERLFATINKQASANRSKKVQP